MSGELLARCRQTLDSVVPRDEAWTGVNDALTVVLDGIEEALDDHVCISADRCNVCRDAWPCSDRRIAIRSLAAIAAALGVRTP